MLPKSITKLHNLETLNVCDCVKLKELPEDTSKLVNLRVLDTYGCLSFNHMPAGMGTLTCLRTLSYFVVCEDDEDLKQDKKGKLNDLLALINNNLRGNLYVNCYAENDPCLERMYVDLRSVTLWFELSSSRKEGQETLLQSLLFSHQFQEMRVSKYDGIKLPSCPSGLVTIDLARCKNLQYLPTSLSQLCHLKYLHLEFMENMEYIECDAPSPSAKFFPSLEKLVLVFMPAFKGWWRDIRWMEKEAVFMPSDIRWMEKEAVFMPSFPRLCKLHIEHCKRLAYIAPCPLVTELYLYEVNEALGNCMKVVGVQSNSFCLERFGTDNSCIFNTLGREFVGTVVYYELSEIENLGTIREAFRSCASSLRDLIISNCRGLENLGIENLTNLESLTLEYNIEGIPWRSLHSLSSLEIIHVEEVALPKGIQHLTSLQTLVLGGCSKLSSLPEEMHCLSSLITLKLMQITPELKNRCCNSDGEDWFKICHIPNLVFSDC